MTEKATDNDPVHQQRLQQIREAFKAALKELGLRGDHWDAPSQPKGGHTNVGVSVRRRAGVLESRMRQWYNKHLDHEREIVKMTRGGSFIVRRSKCVYCGKAWFEHEPAGGQCIFAPTRYREHAR
jgi:hypothetical protein